MFAAKEIEYSPQCAPSILIAFINMILFKETPYIKECKSANIYGGQPVIEKFLILIALACVPVMLLAKPCKVLYERKKQSSSVCYNC